MRFASRELEELSPDERRVADRALQGPRKKVGPPFKTLLYSPGVADPIERLGEYVRYKIEIPARLSELVILLIARHWTAQHPWMAHYRAALEAGLTREPIEAIAAGKRPVQLSDADAKVYDFCASLLNGEGVSDELFSALSASYGKKGVVDLIGLIGYYITLSMTVVVDSHVPSSSDVPPLQPLDKA